MPDQEFKINIRTVADTTGIQLTQKELTALQTAAAQGNQKAIGALNQLKNATAQAQSSLGFSGAAVGVGTIGTLLTGAIGKWKDFIDEQNRFEEALMKQREKAREFGLELADVFDAMKSEERIKTEPLENSLKRLTYDASRLKTEMKQSFSAGDYKDTEKLLKQLNVVEAQIDRVTAALKRKKDEEAREAKQFKQDALAHPEPYGNEVERLASRLGELKRIGQRTDLTPAESEAARKEYLNTEKALRDEQIKSTEENRKSQAEFTKARYEGPGADSTTLRTLDYFEKGPGLAPTGSNLNQKLDDILQYMKSVWGY